MQTRKSLAPRQYLFKVGVFVRYVPGRITKGHAIWNTGETKHLCHISKVMRNKNLKSLYLWLVSFYLFYSNLRKPLATLAYDRPSCIYIVARLGYQSAIEISVHTNRQES